MRNVKHFLPLRIPKKDQFQAPRFVKNAHTITQKWALISKHQDSFDAKRLMVSGLILLYTQEKKRQKSCF
jgi:hypothetical protein